MRSNFASMLGLKSPRKKTTKRRQDKPRQQMSGFQELRVTRSKNARRTPTDGGCKSPSKPNLVGSVDEIKAVLARVRRYSCSSAKKRRMIARVLGLEKTLFTPKHMIRVQRGDKLVYSLPATGKVVGSSVRTENKYPEDYIRHIYTRNTDYIGDMWAIDKKISLMQNALFTLQLREISDKAVKLLRRISVVFSSLHTQKFQKLLGYVTHATRSYYYNRKDLETLPWPWSNRSRTGGVFLSNKIDRVVRHPRYGDIPVLRKRKGSPQY